MCMSLFHKNCIDLWQNCQYWQCDKCRNLPDIVESLRQINDLSHGMDQLVQVNEILLMKLEKQSLSHSSLLKRNVDIDNSIRKLLSKFQAKNPYTFLYSDDSDSSYLSTDEESDGTPQQEKPARRRTTPRLVKQKAKPKKMNITYNPADTQKQTISNNHDIPKRFQKSMSLSSVTGTTLLTGDNSVTSFGSVDPNISIRSDKNMKIHDVYAYLASLPEKCVDNIIMVMGSNDCDSHSDVNRIMTEYRNVINVARRVCSSHIY